MIFLCSVRCLPVNRWQKKAQHTIYNANNLKSAAKAKHPLIRKRLHPDPCTVSILTKRRPHQGALYSVNRRLQLRAVITTHYHVDGMLQPESIIVCTLIKKDAARACYAHKYIYIYIYNPFVYRDGAGWPASLPYICKICVSVAIGTQSGIRLHKMLPMVKLWGPSKNDQNQIMGKLFKL